MRMAMNARITALDDINYSDDQLAYLPYYVHLVHSENAADLDPGMLCSFLRTWAVSGQEYSALYAGIHSAVLKSVRPELISKCGAGVSVGDIGAAVEEDRCNVVWDLQTMQMDFFAWDTDLTLRDDFVMFDIPSDYSGGRPNGGSVPSRRRPLPLNERSRLNWAGSPTAAKVTGGGLSATDPGMFILGYYLALYHGLI